MWLTWALARRVVRLDLKITATTAAIQMMPPTAAPMAVAGLIVARGGARLSIVTAMTSSGAEVGVAVATAVVVGLVVALVVAVVVIVAVVVGVAPRTQLGRG